MNQPWYVILLLLTLSSSLTYVTCRKIGGKVLLETVKAITLKKGKYTNSRRVSAIPQITCINGCHLASPNRIQCKNSGSDGVDIQWECSTDLPAGVSFEAVEVLCEGYDYPEDEYVLKGSCGVEYSLSGHRSDNHSQHSSWGNGYADSDPYGYSSSDYSYDRSEMVPTIQRIQGAVEVLEVEVEVVEIIGEVEGVAHRVEILLEVMTVDNKERVLEAVDFFPEQDSVDYLAMPWVVQPVVEDMEDTTIDIAEMDMLVVVIEIQVYVFEIDFLPKFILYHISYLTKKNQMKCFFTIHGGGMRFSSRGGSSSSGGGTRRATGFGGTRRR